MGTGDGAKALVDCGGGNTAISGTPSPRQALNGNLGDLIPLMFGSSGFDPAKFDVEKQQAAIHCMYGPGAETFDPLTAMEQWVENGTVPETMVAKNEIAGFERPVCGEP